MFHIDDFQYFFWFGGFRLGFRVLGSFQYTILIAVSIVQLLGIPTSDFATISFYKRKYLGKDWSNYEGN